MGNIKPFLCTRCFNRFETKGELLYHKCDGVPQKVKKPVELINPVVIEADQVVIEKAIELEKEVEKITVETTIKVEAESVKTEEDETEAIKEKLALMPLSETEIKDYGKAHGVDKRKLNNKAKEEMIDIILANKKD